MVEKEQRDPAKRQRARVRRNRLMALALLLILLGGFFIYKQYKRSLELKEMAMNREIVKAMELRSVSDMEKRLKEIRGEYKIGRMSLDQIPNRKFFEDSVFMGDSLTEAMASYDLLPQTNVVAKVGRNLKSAHEDLSRLNNLAPNRIFFWYGMNDLSNNGTAEAFVEDYKKLINAVKAKHQSVEVVILSILPANKAAQTKEPAIATSRVQAFNEAVKKMALAEGYGFIDATPLITENLYEPDGIHVVAKFYQELFALIKEEMINAQ